MKASESRAAYEAVLGRALEARGFPGEIGAAFQACHLAPHAERVSACDRVRDAQGEAHRLTLNRGAS